MRRAGYTNAVFPPMRWSDNAVVGATELNKYLRGNILALDNRATPFLPSVIHWTPPSQVNTVANGTSVFLGSPSTGVNMLQLSKYSPNIAISIDVNMKLSSVTASSFAVEAALHMRDAVPSLPLPPSEYPWPNTYLYRPYVVGGTQGLWDLATNGVAPPCLGATQYAFWTGFKRTDVLGETPFALTGDRYSCSVSLAIHATNGSLNVSDITWALRFRANTVVTVESDPNLIVPSNEVAGAEPPFYGQIAY